MHGKVLLCAGVREPRQSLLGCRERGQAADEGDVRVVAQLDSEVRVLVSELTQNN